MSEIKNREVICDCGEKMYMEYSTSLIVPESMRSYNIVEMSNINSNMKNLPSGKRKAIY